MNVIQLPQSNGSVQPPAVIKGRGLALRKLTKTQRALLLRDIVFGSVQLADLSVRQLAAAVNVSVTYAHAAIHLQAGEYVDIRRGLRPLIQPKAPAPPQSPRERIDQVVAEIGYDATLTMLVANSMDAAAA